MDTLIRFPLWKMKQRPYLSKDYNNDTKGTKINRDSNNESR